MNYQKKKNREKCLPETFYFLWHYLEWGGAQVLFFGLMKEAKKNGRVKVLMPAGSNAQLLKFLDNLAVSYEFFEAHTDGKPALTIKRKFQRHWNKLYCEYNIYKFLKRLDLSRSIVHAEFAPWQSMLMLIWLCRQTTTFITMHNSLPSVGKWRRLIWKIKFGILTRFRNFNLFTANHDTKNSLKPFVSNNFLEAVRVIYANVNPSEIEAALSAKISRAEYLEKYNLPANKFLVFCVGQFIDRKGRWIFLEAARRIVEEDGDTAFVWISNYQPSIEELNKADSFGIGENFRFLSSDQIGEEHVDLFKLMRLADVFALPSYLEGLPISIIEAMALGIPTIATNINAVPEAVIHLETGLLIEPGNIESLVNAIRLVKNDEQLREKLSVQGRRYALGKFDEQTQAKIAVETYTGAYRRK